MKQYSPTGRRNNDRPLKRLLDAWDRNGSTSGPTPWKIDDDNDDDDDDDDDDDMKLTGHYKLPVAYINVITLSKQAFHKFARKNKCNKIIAVCIAR